MIRKTRGKFFSALLTLALILSMFAGLGTTAYATVGVTGGDTITASGTYTVDGSNPGLITILPGLQAGVTLQGATTANPIDGISFYVGAETPVTIDQLYIRSPYQTDPIFDFEKTGFLDFAGTSLLETNGISNGAVLHIAPGGTLDIGTNASTEDILYIYKSSGGTAVGGNNGEAGGSISFNGGTVLIRGSRTGAAVGGGDMAGTSGPTNGDVSFNGGNINITTISQGAGVGSGRYGTNAGNVYLNAGNLSITCDSGGAAFGDPGVADAGSLYINGGSLEISLTRNSTRTPDNVVATKVYDLNGDPDPTPLYITPASSPVSVSLDGATEFYSGTVNPWTFVRQQSSTLASWTDVDVTDPEDPERTIYANKSIYLYVPQSAQEVYIDDVRTDIHPVAFKYGYHDVWIALDQFFPRAQAFTLDPFDFRVGALDDYSTVVPTAEDATLLGPGPDGEYTASSLGPNATVFADEVPGVTVSFAATNATVYVNDQASASADVKQGGSLTFVPVPAAGYAVTGVSTGGAILAPNPDGSYTLTDVTADVTVTVTAAQDQNAWSANADTSWYTAGQSVFTLDTAAELAGLAALVNGGTDSFAGKTVLLGADIDLQNYEWTPIGGASSMQAFATREERMLAAYLAGGGSPSEAPAPPSTDPEDYGLGPDDPIPAELLAGSDRSVPTGSSFAGVFDGQGHTVSGLSVTRIVPTYGGYGLFGYVNGGTLQNLAVAGQGVRTGASADAVGGVVGFTTGSLYGVTNDAAIMVHGDAAAETGGVAGVVDASGGGAAYVQFAINNADVDGSTRLGGVVGAAYCEIDGGVLIDQSGNAGDITAAGGEGRSYVGGVVGYDEGYVKNSFNTGDVAATEEGTYFYVGGIAGLLNGAAQPYAAISDSYNTGAITTAHVQIPAQPLFAYADDSDDVDVSDCVYLDSMAQDPLGATLTDVSAVTAAQMGSTTALPGTLSSAYFTPASPSPSLNWQGAAGIVGPIYVDPTIAPPASPDGTITNPYDNLGDALSALSVFRNTIYVTAPLTADRFPSTVDMAVADARVARGNANTGDMFTLGQDESLSLAGGIIDGQAGPVAVTGSLIEVDGGAFAISDGAMLRGNNNSTGSGTPTNRGGAIHVAAGTAALGGGRIVGNSSDYGGAICVEGGSATMDGGWINSNNGQYGGAFHVSTGGTADISDGVLDDNFAWSGGGLRVDGGTVDFGGAATISNGRAYNGGGIYQTGGTVTMDGGRIDSNGSQASNGGGVYISGGTFTLDSGNIDSNRSTTNGGGVYLTGTGSFVMNGGEVTYNIATGASSGGGGVYVSAGTAFTMTGGIINHNSARYGVGVYVAASDTFTIAPSAALTFGSSDAVYLATGVTFNIGATLAPSPDNVSMIPLGFADPSDERLTAIAEGLSYAAASAAKLTYQTGWSFFDDGFDIYLSAPTKK
jgi:hypothetical protein